MKYLRDMSEVMYPFPIRENLMAVLHLPPDLTRAEAERLSEFVLSLAHPVKP